MAQRKRDLPNISDGWPAISSEVSLIVDAVSVFKGMMKRIWRSKYSIKINGHFCASFCDANISNEFGGLAKRTFTAYFMPFGVLFKPKCRPYEF